MMAAKEFETILNKTFAEIENKVNESSKTRGLASGFSELDDFTHGFHNGELTLIQGRPTVGKTAFGLSVVTKATSEENDATVAIFELEMGASATVQRLLALEARASIEHLRTGELTAVEWSSLKWVKKRLTERKILIDDTPKQTVYDIRKKMKQYKNQYGVIDLVIVDYLQLIATTNNKNRHQEIADILRELKKIARDYNTSVVVLSQLKDATKIENVTQGHSDISAIDVVEKDVDVNIFLYRNAKTNSSGDWVHTEMVVAKNSAGPLGIGKIMIAGTYGLSI